MKYLLVTEMGKRFHILDNGDIVRLDMPDFKPNGKWKAHSLVQYNNFGNVVTRKRTADSMWDDWDLSAEQWTFKNGKGRWRMRDIDHGTMREWGDRVVRLERLP
jgi:hypothetical protein